MMINNIPYLRKNTSTLLVLSAAFALMLSSLILPLYNLLLQPAQATFIVPTSLQTRNPVDLGKSCSDANATLTFEAKGNGETLTNGTFQITNSSSGQTLWSGDFYSVNGEEGVISLDYIVDGNSHVCGSGSGHVLEIQTGCGYGLIELSTDAGNIGDFTGVVNCEFPSDTTAQPSSSSVTGATTTQDSDGDGIPDSSDNCTHNSNPRCFKEAAT